MVAAVLFAVFAAAVLGAAWMGTRNNGLLLSAGLWSLYAGYEFLMYKRVLCSGDCNIRVDLLLIYPALLVASTAAIAGGIAGAIRRRRGQSRGR